MACIVDASCSGHFFVPLPSSPGSEGSNELAKAMQCLNMQLSLLKLLAWNTAAAAAHQDCWAQRSMARCNADSTVQLLGGLMHTSLVHSTEPNKPVRP